MCKRLTRIDESTLGDHHYLDSNDDCYYLGEYTARAGFAYSEINQLIINFKKSVDRRGRAEWAYKNGAVSRIARDLNDVIGMDANKITFIPVPPSKCKTDPLYDDRLIRVLLEYKKINNDVDCREIVLQKASTDSAHNDGRLTPGGYADLYTIDDSLMNNIREHIIVFDDVVTTGSHFKAMQTVLSNCCPEHNIHGLFVARRCINTDLSEFL